MPSSILRFSLYTVVILSALSVTHAEVHTVTFDNRCGFGTPTLVLDGQIVSTGAAYTIDSVINGIAYLQTGNCNFNGEGCTLLELNLVNPTCAGCGSSVDISLISPHDYSVETSFSYYNGCDGFGKDCNNPNCDSAFHTPTDYGAQAQCEEDNVNLRIAFCGDATQGS